MQNGSVLVKVKFPFSMFQAQNRSVKRHLKQGGVKEPGNSFALKRRLQSFYYGLTKELSLQIQEPFTNNVI